MLEAIALGVILAILVFFMVLAVAGDPGGFWVLGTVGVQVLLVILGIIGIIGIIDMLNGVVVVGGLTGLGLLVIPLLY